MLRDSYCRTIGIEYMHIQDPEQRALVPGPRSSGRTRSPPTTSSCASCGELNEAEAFETFLQTKYVGQKRFSLEGGESLIPLLDAVLSAAAEAGLDEVCIGMAHRGRLNVLANIAGKTYGQIFREFEGTQDPRSRAGLRRREVPPRHRGHLHRRVRRAPPTSTSPRTRRTSRRSTRVLEGIVRAKQDRLNRGGAFFSVLPVLVHGDAAFAGQGVVVETLNLSQLRGYRTGGTDPRRRQQPGRLHHGARRRPASSVYCTDVAKMIQAPIFHVNGDDPEACRAGRASSRSSSARSSTRTSSSTWSATAAAATTRATTPR